MKLIDKAVKRGALHKNTGARKKSRAARLRRSAYARRPRAVAAALRRAPQLAAAMTVRTAAVLSSSPPPPWPRLSDLEVGHQHERAAVGVDVAAARVGDQPVGGEARHPQSPS